MERSVLLYTDDIDAARTEIEAATGRIKHLLSQRALVATIPTVIQSPLAHCTTIEPPGVDPVTHSLAAIWRASQVAKSATASEGKHWNAPSFHAPVGQTAMDIDIANDDTYQRSTGTPTSLYMVGKIIVGVVTVDSTEKGPERFTDEEKMRLREEVLRACDFLASQEPRARIEFRYDFVDTDAPPAHAGKSPDPYDRLESPWRDVALTKIGFKAGREGYQAYVKKIISETKSDWGLVVFFTKFALHHFAYAIWEKVVMHYDNDGWGPENIHRVLAHEICHIFGAADEYGGCKCGTLHGYLKAPNNNCLGCFKSINDQESCLMDRNVLALCQHTRKQIGWDASLMAPASK